jgi:hypothetical protein
VIRFIRGTSQGSDGGEIASCQRRRQSFLRCRIPPADARDDPHPADEPSGVAARVTGLPGDREKATPAFGIGQGDEQAAILCRQRIEPDRRKMRHPGVDYYGVGWPVGLE